jgi:hypothetical protein
MNGGLIFIIVVVSLFGGMALTALAVFLYFFYQSIKRLTVVAEAVYSVVQPLSAGNTLTEVLKAFQSTSKTGKAIVESLAGITAAVVQFNRYCTGQAAIPTAEAPNPVVGTPESPTAKTAGGLDFDNVDSFFIKPTEAEAAQREVEAALRAEGVETNENAYPNGEPPLHAQVGDSV